MRRALTSIALLLCLCLATAWVWWAGRQSSPPSSAPPSRNTVVSSTDCRAGPPDSRPVALPCQAPQPHVSAASPQPAPSPGVRIVNGQGEPLSDLPVRWTLRRGERVQSGLGHTGTGGLLEFPGEACEARLWSEDEDWTLPEDFIPCDIGETAVVQARRNVSLALLVVLADGTPFSGAATLKGVDGSRDWRKDLQFDGLAPLKVRGIPPDGALSLRVSKSVIGYEAQTHELARKDLSEGRTVVITLTPGPAPRGRTAFWKWTFRNCPGR